jgi:hypothetical protein
VPSLSLCLLCTHIKQKDGFARSSLVVNAINSSGGIESVSAEDERDICGLAGSLYGGECNFLSCTDCNVLITTVVLEQGDKKLLAQKFDLGRTFIHTL